MKSTEIKQRYRINFFVMFRLSVLLLNSMSKLIHNQCTCNASINSSGAHPPRATAGHLLTLQVPGVGHSQFYRGPGGWALSIPRGDPRAFDTRVFERRMSLSGKTRPLSQTGLSVMFSKECFLNFRYFFITCKHKNISEKVNYSLFITKPSLPWTLREHDYFTFRTQN